MASTAANCPIFFGSNFVSVTVQDPEAWEYIKPQIVMCISDYITSGLEIVTLQETKLKSEPDISNKTSEELDIINKIKHEPFLLFDGISKF